MAFGSSNRTALRRIAETNFGVTPPTTPELTEIRYTGESLNYNIETVQSKEIRSDRMLSDLIQTKSEASGDISFELSAVSFDDFIEAAMADAWTSDVLLNKTTLSSFTIQKHIQDCTTPVFVNFRGSCINTMNLAFEVGNPLTGAFGIMSLGAAVTETQFTGATIADAPTTDVMNSVSNVVEIKEEGVVSTNEFKSISIDLNNNIRAQDAIGSLEHIGMVLGQVGVSGNISIYFENKTMLDRYIANTSFSISFKVEDTAGNSYTFLLPKVKFQSGAVVSGGLDTDIMFDGTWTALHDSTEDTMIKITRVAV
jgi:hypothetical protein